MDYLTISAQVQNEIVVKRSKFIATISPITSHEQAACLLEEIKDAHPSATHNCYGYLLPPPLLEARFSDDREPQNTAGKPILGILQNKDLSGIMAIVTRYFGGVKLGVGGLASAYRRAVEEGLEQAKTVTMIPSLLASVELDYSESKLLHSLQYPIIKVMDTQYSDKVTIKFAFAKKDLEQMQESILSITQGKGEMRLVGEQYIDYQMEEKK